MVINTKFTHSDLLVMPNDGKRREIVEGELFVTPSPNLQHQRVSRKIELAIAKYLEDHPIGEIFYAPLDVILSHYDVLEPDLLVVLNERRSILQDWVRGAPDLVVEILSPTTATIDRGPKLKAYSRHGVQECWLVDLDQKAIEVHRLGPAGYRLWKTFHEAETLTSELLPDFVLPLATIFGLPK